MIDWSQYPDLNRMWETRGARFCCHQRLIKTNVWVNYAIATGSAYVIFLSLLGILNIGFFNLEDYKVINIASIVISVVIIFLSLIEGGKNYVLRAEAMHNCAREISVVYHRAEGKVRESKEHPADLKEEIQQYDRILDRYNFNHDTLDYEIFMTQKREVYKNIGGAMVAWVSIKKWLSIYGTFIFMLCLTPGLLGLIWFIGERASNLN